MPSTANGAEALDYISYECCRDAAYATRIVPSRLHGVHEVWRLLVRRADGHSLVVDPGDAVVADVDLPVRRPLHLGVGGHVLQRVRVVRAQVDVRGRVLVVIAVVRVPVHVDLFMPPTGQIVDLRQRRARARNGMSARENALKGTGHVRGARTAQCIPSVGVSGLSWALVFPGDSGQCLQDSVVTPCQ